MKTYVLYNNLSNNGKGQSTAEQLKQHWADRELTFVNARDLDDYAGFFAGLQPDDEVCICGGDGTLNYLINHADCDSLTNKLFYFPAGSGNDFWTDLGKKPGDAPEQINRYIKNLPTVTVKGKTSKFINGVGYGIDGYCCEEGDRLREKSDKPINYTSIAIKGLLFRYKPTRADHEGTLLRRRHDGDAAAGQTGGRPQGDLHGDERRRQAAHADGFSDHLQGRACQKKQCPRDEGQGDHRAL